MLVHKPCRAVVAVVVNARGKKDGRFSMESLWGADPIENGMLFSVFAPGMR